MRPGNVHAVHPFGETVAQIRQIKPPHGAIAESIARQIRHIRSSEGRQPFRGGHHIIARQHEAVHEHDRRVGRGAADTRVDIATRHRDGECSPPGFHDVYPNDALPLAGAARLGEAAATCRHMAQHTTPARTAYKVEKVAIGIHKPGIGVTASEVRITS